MMKTQFAGVFSTLASALLATLVGCTANDPHSSAESLLQELVVAQTNADTQHLTRLMYKPESLETLGQSKEDIFNLVLQPGKTVSESQLIDLEPTDRERFEKQYDGVSIRLLPTPIGKLEMRFQETGRRQSNCGDVRKNERQVLHFHISKVRIVVVWSSGARCRFDAFAS